MSGYDSSLRDGGSEGTQNLAQLSSGNNQLPKTTTLSVILPSLGRRDGIERQDLMESRGRGAYDFFVRERDTNWFSRG